MGTAAASPFRLLCFPLALVSFLHRAGPRYPGSGPNAGRLNGLLTIAGHFGSRRTKVAKMALYLKAWANQRRQPRPARGLISRLLAVKAERDFILLLVRERDARITAP